MELLTSFRGLQLHVRRGSETQAVLSCLLSAARDHESFLFLYVDFMEPSGLRVKQRLVHLWECVSVFWLATFSMGSSLCQGLSNSLEYVKIPQQTQWHRTNMFVFLDFFLESTGTADMNSKFGSVSSKASANKLWKRSRLLDFSIDFPPLKGVPARLHQISW